MPKKNMTIDDLGAMVGRGFNDLAGRMNQGFANVDKKFVSIDQRFDGVDKKIETLRTEIHDEFRRIREEIKDVKLKLEQLFRHNIKKVHLIV